MGWSRSLFVLLLAVLIAVIGARVHGTWRDVSMAVAGALFAAVVFAWVYQSQLEKFVIDRTEAIISNAVAEGAKQINSTVDRLLSAHIMEIGKRLQHHLPSRIWPASDAQHDQFVNMVDDHLTRSSSYKYKGDRALYLCCRLQRLRESGKLPSNLRMEILLLDPRDHRCLEATSRYRMTRSGMAGASLTDMSDELRQDIFCSIYGLYKLRECCEITVAVIKEIPLFRVELVGGAMFLSIMPSLQSGRYPDTVYYEQSADYVTWFQRYLDNLFSSVPHADVFRLSAVKSDPDVVGLLQQLGCNAALAELEIRLLKYRKNI